MLFHSLQRLSLSLSLSLAMVVSEKWVSQMQLWWISPRLLTLQIPLVCFNSPPKVCSYFPQLSLLILFCTVYSVYYRTIKGSDFPEPSCLNNPKTMSSFFVPKICLFRYLHYAIGMTHISNLLILHSLSLYTDIKIVTIVSIFIYVFIKDFDTFLNQPSFLYLSLKLEAHLLLYPEKPKQRENLWS